MLRPHFPEHYVNTGQGDHPLFFYHCPLTDHNINSQPAIHSCRDSLLWCMTPSYNPFWCSHQICIDLKNGLISGICIPEHIKHSRMFKKTHIKMGTAPLIWRWLPSTFTAANNKLQLQRRHWRWQESLASMPHSNQYTYTHTHTATNKHN